MRKDQAEFTMGLNGDMLKVFVTSAQTFCLIVLLNFSYVSHEKLCLRSVGFGNYGRFEKNI